MAIYLVGYDLKKPGQDYTLLTEHIKAISQTWWHCLDSTWLIRHQGTAVQIREALLPYMDSNDKLLVALMAQGDSAWTLSFTENCRSWLKSNLS